MGTEGIGSILVEEGTHKVLWHRYQCFEVDLLLDLGSGL